MESRKQTISEREELLPLLKTRVTQVFGKNHHFGGIHIFTPSADVPDDYGTGPRLVVLPVNGAYSRSDSFTHHSEPFWELKGKRLGIIGLGTIGRQVARIAESFGMEVVFYSTTGRNNHISYKRFELDDLLMSSDVVSIHAPLNPQTRNLLTYDKIKLMRPCAILLNLGRGGIINEQDLAHALNDNLIGAAGIDVLEHEPINADNPLLKLYDKDKILITPHMAWASKESRELLVEKIARNIEIFQHANPNG
jgi:glycerate dehydrogenase